MFIQGCLHVLTVHGMPTVMTVANAIPGIRLR